MLEKTFTEVTALRCHIVKKYDVMTFEIITLLLKAQTTGITKCFKLNSSVQDYD